ncbi:MAG TPA: lyase family protein, partial [Polyangiaceae bacterium]
QIALELRLLQRTEVGEVEERRASAYQGSSAMPHKRNPVLSENLCGLARVVRAAAAPALENVALWHERDISHSSVERMIAPDATATLGFMLERAAGLVEGLVVYRERLQKNLELTGGLFFSEAVMLALVEKGLLRQSAYELVQRSAMRAFRGEGEFRTLLGEDPDISSRLTPAELTACFDLEHALRYAELLVERAARA